MRIGSPIAVVHGHGPWRLRGSRGEDRGKAWFGDRIPGEEDASRFFGRRGGPDAAWTNSAAQVLRETMPDWDVAVCEETVVRQKACEG